MSEYDDEELARLRAQRQKELQQQTAQKEQMEQQRQQMELQKQLLLSKFLTDEAKTRLNNIKMANPEYAARLEDQIIQIGQSGRLQGTKISDEQLKQMLRQITQARKEPKINIKRK